MFGLTEIQCINISAQEVYERKKFEASGIPDEFADAAKTTRAATSPEHVLRVFKQLESGRVPFTSAIGFNAGQPSENWG